MTSATFLTGATGYVGSHLLETVPAKVYRNHVTALLREPSVSWFVGLLYSPAGGHRGLEAHLPRRVHSSVSPPEGV